MADEAQPIQGNAFENSYNPSPTVLAMHAFIQEMWVEKNIPLLVGILGPAGSGKSVGSIQAFEWIYRAVQPNVKGKRKSKIGICRKTIANIRNSTLPTLQKWFPYEMGAMNHTTSTANRPIEGQFKIPYLEYYTDGTAAADETLCEVGIQGIHFQDDIEEAINALKSTEWTAVYLNELFSLPPQVIPTFIERTGRYPSGIDGQAKAKLVICDYNMPPEGNWAVDLHEKNGTHYMCADGILAFAKEGDPIPEGAEIIYIQKIFVQPAAILKVPEYADPENPEKVTGHQYIANELAEIPPIYTYNPYLVDLATRLSMRQYREIDRELCMLVVPDADKTPVYKDVFVFDEHVIENQFDPAPLRETVLGFDTSGMHPCIIKLQKIDQGWVATDEYYGAGETILSVIQHLEATTIEGGSKFAKYSKELMHLSCDPANARNQYTGTTPVDILAEHGFSAAPASATNIHAERKNALTICLCYSSNKERAMRGQDEGRHPLQIYISKRCPNLIKALQTGHVYRKIRGAGEGIYQLKPDKTTDASHYVDALEYGALEIISRSLYSMGNRTELDSIGAGYNAIRTG